jgi:hypothetical protein
VYWVVEDPEQPYRGELWRIAIAGGAPQRLAEGLAGPRDVVVDRRHIYWIEARTRTIQRIAKP